MSLKARLRALEKRVGPPNADPYAGQRAFNAACRRIYGKPGDDEDEEEEFTMTDEEAHAAFMAAVDEIYSKRSSAPPAG